MARESFFTATAMPDDDWWQDLWPDPRGVLAKIGLGPGMNVIDLCCGNGHFTVPLAGLVGVDGKVSGVDMDPDMLKQAKARLQRGGDKGARAVCDWYLEDAYKINRVFKDYRVADVLLIANTFHGAPDKTALSSVVAKVLKPEGSFIIINWHPMAREETVVLGQPRGPKMQMRMSPKDVEVVVIPAGFALKEVIELPPYHYAIVFNLA